MDLVPLGTHVRYHVMADNVYGKGVIVKQYLDNFGTQCYIVEIEGGPHIAVFDSEITHILRRTREEDDH